MAEHNQITETSVAGETAKGAAKGALAPFVGVLAVAAVATALIAPPVLAFMAVESVALGILAAGVTAAVMAVTGVSAAIGGIFGFGKGVLKSGDGSKELEAQARRDQEMAKTIEAAQKQAYQVGVGAGQMEVINEIKKVQDAQLASAQERTTNFAANVKKGAITPEQIIQQREAAAAAQQSK